MNCAGGMCTTAMDGARGRSAPFSATHAMISGATQPLATMWTTDYPQSLGAVFNKQRGWRT
jgi:hypothetical protein